ncbi:MAG: GH92 family glycosyl hydrolase [Planctomycetota bacterium]|jgi:predicted alpha-1,2-mannosidase
MSTQQKIMAVLIAGLWLISYTSRGEEVSPKPTISVSSIYNAEYAARFAVDGNPSTRWASENNDQGDLILDFGKVYDVNQIAIVWESAYAAEYKIDIAGEDKRWKTLRQKKDGKGGTDTFKDLKSEGRYMRIQCMRYGPHSLWSIWEIKFANPRLSAALKQAGEVRHKKKKRAQSVSRFAGYSIGARAPRYTVDNPTTDGLVPVWEIGALDSSSGEFALAPDRYEDFLKHDFGWENRFYLIGHHTPKDDFPYALPGASSTWGGTWGSSGWRTHVLNILFGLKEEPTAVQGKLRVALSGNDPAEDTLLKVTVNGHSWKEYIPKGKGSLNSPDNQQRRVMEFPVQAGMLRRGGNEVNLTILRGSWVTFDAVRLLCSQNVTLATPEKAFVRSVEPAGYELKSGQRVQPLLVHVEHLEGEPELSVLLDGKQIFTSILAQGNYIFEAPMPAVPRPRTASYEIRLDGKTLQTGTVERSPGPLQTPADYVDTLMGTGHSRWMIAPGPWMPFSMVKLSPDNQNGGWQAGYEPSIENIGTFSHVHEWTLGGLGIMPTAGELETVMGTEHCSEDGYRSEIDKTSERAPLGHYEVLLTDYNIKAELTATTRCGFQRYTYSGNARARVMVDLKIPAENGYRLEDVELRKVGDRRIEGCGRHVSSVWGGNEQDYTVHFVVEFDQPIAKFGVWENEKVAQKDLLKCSRAADAGSYAEFDTSKNRVVQVRSGISYVSIENAALNLETEISKPFGWDFEAVKKYNKQTWNNLLGRLSISTNDRGEKVRFYSNMYRALASRNIFSDVNGQWTDPSEKTRQLTGADDVALGCDAFWNTFWNLNQFWNLAAPEWSSRWVRSQLALYETHGWLAKGPAGMEYVPVMVAEHEIPLIVGAYQMGIRDYDADTAFEAVVKMQTTPAVRVGGGLAGNRDLKAYLAHGYVPYDKGKFSNSLEYSYDDWTVGQFAKALGKTAEYEQFNERGYWWKNVVDKETGYARLRDSKGNWKANFDPIRDGANHEYTEGSAWQLTYFVPQDVPALIETIGRDRFLERLEWGFEQSEKFRFNAPRDQYWDYPVVQGNQQAMHFAYLFNWAGKPWLTQQWSRSIMERYYGRGVSNAYLGDEDQGQMSAWFVMSAIGLFQTDGGCRVDPIYEIASPLYEKVVIDLGKRYGRGKTFTIEAKNASRKNKYVQKAILNGKELNTFHFPASELLKGGALVLEMGDQPNKSWGALSNEGPYVSSN